MKKVILIIGIAVAFAASAAAQSFVVKPSQAELKWEGKKVTGKHDGTILLKSGEFEVKGNKIVSGTFVIDMQSLTVDDLPEGGMNDKLKGHLKSDDFFGVEKFPTSKLVLKESSKFKDNKAAVKAHLTIRDKTNPVEFEVTRENGKYMAKIVVDRSKYNVKYGSGSFFDGLGDKMIYDDFTLDVTLNTK